MNYPTEFQEPALILINHHTAPLFLPSKSPIPQGRIVTINKDNNVTLAQIGDCPFGITTSHADDRTTFFEKDPYQIVVGGPIVDCYICMELTLQEPHNGPYEAGMWLYVGKDGLLSKQTPTTGFKYPIAIIINNLADTNGQIECQPYSHTIPELHFLRIRYQSLFNIPPPQMS